ncbi:hypothetical protein BZG02_09670 [Labilibaculum filiforme]|uniref:DUF5675 domain-containing protein n=1 Tax=Labilibaculum filiforme TaxID=1940526 RepID=A0A2N3HY85_9BACT|nr:DUF5675 family protein [Labilibaculum filiforme]PKQ63030.1 hypothetical protein BZG02_09670 [Labilibaculum filiforme]
MSDLEIWEGVEIRKSSYRTKFVNGALMSSPVTFGGYLIYKYGKWVYERMAYGDKKKEEIPLSPFPIDDPVVTHFHPVAFVEQMRRMGDDPYTIRITREAERWTGTNKSSMTFGTFVFGSLEGFICEPYGDETTERGKDKRIPAGIYNVKWHVSGNYPKNKYTLQHKLGKKWHLDYPSFKHGVLLVYNESVPQSRGILVHAGQDGGWTEGCILPSSKQDRNLDKWNMTMADSVETLHKIFNQIEETGIENIKLVITDETE